MGGSEVGGLPLPCHAEAVGFTTNSTGGCNGYLVRGVVSAIYCIQFLVHIEIAVLVFECSGCFSTLAFQREFFKAGSGEGVAIF